MEIIIIEYGKKVIETPKNFIVPNKQDLLILEAGCFKIMSVEYNYPRNEITVLIY